MYSLNRFRRRCRAVRTLATAVALGLLLLLAVSIAPNVLGVATGHADHPQMQWLLLGCVRLLPGLCFLWALWAVRRAFGELAAGQLFQPTVAAGMRQVGYAVLVGALIQVFAVTNLDRWIMHGHGGYALFDPSSIVLGIVGAALVLLARVMEQARHMQAELDGMI